MVEYPHAVQLYVFLPVMLVLVCTPRGAPDTMVGVAEDAAAAAWAAAAAAASTETGCDTCDTSEATTDDEGCTVVGCWLDTTA